MPWICSHKHTNSHQVLDVCKSKFFHKIYPYLIKCIHNHRNCPTAKRIPCKTKGWAEGERTGNPGRNLRRTLLQVHSHSKVACVTWKSQSQKKKIPMKEHTCNYGCWHFHLPEASLRLVPHVLVQTGLRLCSVPCSKISSLSRFCQVWPQQFGDSILRSVPARLTGRPRYPGVGTMAERSPRNNQTFSSSEMVVLTDDDDEPDSSSNDGGSLHSDSDAQEDLSWDAGHLLKSGLSLSLSQSSLKSPGFWTNSNKQEEGLAYSALVRCVDQTSSNTCAFDHIVLNCFSKTVIVQMHHSWTRSFTSCTRHHVLLNRLSDRHMSVVCQNCVCLCKHVRAALVSHVSCWKK
jgi:hypothetical protein